MNQLAATGTLPAAADPRAARAAVDLARFTGLLAQLGLVLVAVWGLDLQVGQPGLLRLLVVASAGFALHYFTPFAYKKQAFLAISMIGGVIVLTVPEEQTYPALYVTFGASCTIGLAAVMAIAFMLILRWKVPFMLRVGVIGVIALAFIWMRLTVFLPAPVWPVIGAIFMFRLIVYAYDVRVARAPESALDTLCYFLLLPNYYFPVFPVIDYTVFKKSYYADDIHATAQRGISWIARGVLHLALYRVIYHRVLIGPDEVQGFWSMLRWIFPAFWWYLNVSGAFHIIVGIMHLFGWKLPETNRKYFLASSFTDFWRRINIYWKDFMVKCFYYPAYFRLRKRSETLALILATALVFVATTVLHAWQMFWIQGDWSITGPDAVFWGTLGALVMATVVWEARRGRPRQRSRAAALALRVVSTLGVYVTISVLWSIWRSGSLTQWYEIVAYWR